MEVKEIWRKEYSEVIGKLYSKRGRREPEHYGNRLFFSPMAAIAISRRGGSTTEEPINQRKEASNDQ